MTTTTTTRSTANGTAGLAVIDATVLHQWLNDDNTVLVDVREGFEHAAERIAGSRHHPLSRFDAGALHGAHPGARVVFYCRSGRRSADAATRFAGLTARQAIHLQGGIESWKRAGLPTERNASAPRIDVLRQVQITAGSLVLAGVLLGAFVSPWFLLLAGFVGLGQVFTGASGWCGMAMLLSAMPWNRVAPPAGGGGEAACRT